ncbi:MAG: TraR/DksA family transcriptional regulator [Syntrophales bacterium]|jgi:DnaK suppressor protein|nr:TraR/DksA family transcriptional regulator [Syntrophales bacterium]MCK9390042.1 TraR/DksA family transcriptional regulator [Syntrophales bacterium]
MNTNNVHYLKSLLINNLHDLHLSAGKTSAEMKTDEKLFPDPLDRATADLGRGVDLIIRGRERELIREIEEALTRIDQGEFGICQNCGSTISDKRLWAKPTSSLCVECKEKEEGRQRRRSILNDYSAMASHSYMSW